MRGQRGQTAAEYMGVLFLAATLVAAIAGSGLGAGIDHAVTAQICHIRDREGCSQPTEARTARASGAVARAASVGGGPTAHTANIPCDGLKPRVCAAIRGMINRAIAEHQRLREAYIKYAADFALWVAGAEGIKNVRDVIWRPGIFDAVNALIRRQVNREGARLLTSVTNKPLFNVIRSNYRYGAKIGKGSTADALRDEVARGVPYGTSGSHYMKAQQTITRLNKLLKTQKLSRRETQIATNIRQELHDALPPQYRIPLK
jgi:hypothetical protein